MSINRTVLVYHSFEKQEGDLDFPSISIAEANGGMRYSLYITGISPDKVAKRKKCKFCAIFAKRVDIREGGVVL